MEPEGSQGPATVLYPELDECCLHPNIIYI
jgi:hypothetical protein